MSKQPRKFNSYHTLGQVDRTHSALTPNTQKQLATRRSGLVPNTFYTKGGMTNIDPSTIKLAQKAADAVTERKRNPMTEGEMEAWAESLAADGVAAGESEFAVKAAVKVGKGDFGEFEDVVEFMRVRGIAIPPHIQERIDVWQGEDEETDFFDPHAEDDMIETLENDGISLPVKVWAAAGGIDLDEISAEPVAVAPAALRPGRNPAEIPAEMMPGNVVPSRDRPGSVRVMEPRPTQPPAATTKPTLVPPGTGRNVPVPEITAEGQAYPSNPPIEGAINLPPSARPPQERGMPIITPVKPKSSS